MQDLILGLQSDDYDRYGNAIAAIPDVLASNPNDIEIMGPELCQFLFRCQNKFELEGFWEKKYEGLI